MNESNEEPLKQLTPIEILFCHEYAVDLNGTQAGIRAKFKGTYNTIAKRASDYLKKPHIRAYLSEVLNLNTVSVLNELCHLAFANLTDVCEFNSRGLTFKDSKDLTPRARSAIKSIKVTETILPEGGSSVTTTIAMHDKVQAVDKLMRKLRLYPNNIPAIEAMKVLAGDGFLLPDQMDAVQGGLDTIRANMQVIANDRVKATHQESALQSETAVIKEP